MLDFQSRFTDCACFDGAHGFVSLALAMIVLGVNMLGNLNKGVD